MDTSSTDSDPHLKNKHSFKYLAFLTLGALGVVYGDIGTSPLYALKECFNVQHGLVPNHDNVLGVLSLIFWSLIIIVTIKYHIFIIKFDNHGEGGILALMELVLPKDKRARYFVVLTIGLFGASLLYGDGIITPAISVLSAVEGLNVATPFFEPFILPLTLVVLFVLFYFQKRGTTRIGVIFGPITFIWFISIAVLGIGSIIQNTEVLNAVNPVYAVNFFSHNGFLAFIILGSVFLVVTGGEALYADMGHFGRKAIRLAWFSTALPCLMINYFGQGAMLLRNPSAVGNPFYHLAPEWALYPLVILATMATVIASQAVISGAFSLTQQAIQLGFLPRVRIIHTSNEERGQIYIPQINWLLFIAIVFLVLQFRSSSNLAAAYGVAITTTMVITTLLAYVAMRKLWNWSIIVSASVAMFFLAVDVAFFSSNMLKILQGGWFPLALGLIVYFIMITWNNGRKLLRSKMRERTQPLDEFIEEYLTTRLTTIPGTAVYMYSIPHETPPALAQNLKHNKILHKQIVILNIVFKTIPRVNADERLFIDSPAENFYRAVANYGFMEQPNVTALIEELNTKGVKIDMNKATFYLGRELMVPGENLGWLKWRIRLFMFLSRNAQRPTEYFNIPSDRVYEAGTQITI